MRKSSWLLLSLSGVLLAGLYLAYRAAQQTPETYTPEAAHAMIAKMQDAVAHKRAGDIMEYITPDPDAHILDMTTDQLRLLIARGLRSSQGMRADVSDIKSQSTVSEATVTFQLAVTHHEPNMVATDYGPAKITFRLQPVPVPHLLGIYHTSEWRIVAAETTGLSPASFGD